MSPEQITILIISLLGFLLIFRVHIGVALGVSSFLGLLMIMGFGPTMTLVKMLPFSATYNYSLTIIPLFILMGLFLFESGFAGIMYNCAYKVMGKMPGSLSIATTMSCAAFGSVCGSSVATSALFTKLSLPEMLKNGYSKPLAAGSITGAGCLAALIPPSSMMVLYSILTEQSIGRGQMAGLLPGLVGALIMAGVIFIWVRLRPNAAPPMTVKISTREKVQSFLPLWPLIPIVLTIWGGIYSGIFTPNEAAALGAFEALIVLVFYKKRDFPKHALRAALECIRSTAMIFLIIIGALLFARFMAATRVPMDIATFIGDLQVNRYVILFAFALLYIVMGTFLESIGIMAITLPIVIPIMVALQFNLIWFGVIVVILLEIGLMTPPVGIQSYVVKGMAGDAVSLKDIFKGEIPFEIGYCLLIFLLVVFPPIALWIPSQM